MAARDTIETWQGGIGYHFSTNKYTALEPWFEEYQEALEDYAVSGTELQELQVRTVDSEGAKIIGISNIPNDVYDAMIEMPRMDNELLYPLVEIIPLQLFSYYLALHNNADPDFPRNLAKSVTAR